MSWLDNSGYNRAVAPQDTESSYIIGTSIPETTASLGADSILKSPRHCCEAEARQLAEQILRCVEREHSVSLVTIRTSLGNLHWQGGGEDDFSNDDLEPEAGVCHGAVTSVIEYVRALPFREREALSLLYGEVELSDEKAAEVMRIDVGIVREHVVALRAIVIHGRQVDFDYEAEKPVPSDSARHTKNTRVKSPFLPSRDEFAQLLAGTKRILETLSHDQIAAVPLLFIRKQTSELAQNLRLLTHNVRTLGSVDYTPNFCAPQKWYHPAISQLNEFVSILKGFREVLRQPLFHELRPDSTDAGRFLSLIAAEFSGIADLVESRHIRLKREPNILDAMNAVLIHINTFVELLNKDYAVPREKIEKAKPQPRIKAPKERVTQKAKEKPVKEPEELQECVPVEVPKSVVTMAPASPPVQPEPQIIQDIPLTRPVTPERLLASNAQHLASTVSIVDKQCADRLSPSIQLFELMKKFIAAVQGAREVFQPICKSEDYSVRRENGKEESIELRKLADAVRSVSTLLERLLPESEAQDKLRLRLECELLSGYCELHASAKHMNLKDGKSAHAILTEFAYDANSYLVAMQRLARESAQKSLKRVS